MQSSFSSLEKFLNLHLGVVSQVAGRTGEHKGHPREVTKGKHVAEAVCGDVHGGQDGGLVP
jgi:hypothetical protein